MKNFYDWIKEFVHDQGEFIAQQSGWLELERSSYAKLIAQTISHVLNGGSLLVSADSSRCWFLNYILSNLNPKDLKERPLLSVIDFNASSFYPKNDANLSLATIEMTYQNPMFWHVGKIENESLKTLLLSKIPSFLWLFEELKEDCLLLKEHDSLLDYKLLQLFKLFENALFSALYNKVAL
ncbi:DNA replication regulator family protein [Helicobacter pylori]|uniref:HobA family DNA replication regulator n=1 Tax=Helicobacter pylori TaxID=210 RepID=UPI001AE241E1|nr:HobA family DNA replication regulator [Helicobacter pylori]QTO96649.1 DNA replication regulator family protein [Helicobacter pylori]